MACACSSAQSPHAVGTKVEVLDPNAPFRRIWDGVQVVFLIYVSVFVPFRVCFDVPPEPWHWDFCFDILVDFFFLVDVALSFFTGYARAPDGHTEWRRTLVIRHYLRGWFIIDLLSVLPVNYVVIAFDDSKGNVGAFRLLRFTKLLKLLRLMRVKRIVERYETLLGVLHSTGGNWFQMFKLTLAIFWVGHMMCCFWFLAGDDEVGVDAAGNEVIISAGWVSGQGLRAPGSAKAQAYHADGSAITHFDQYLTSLYWGMTTMTTVGYGDISASTTAEKVYSIVSMLVGGFMFGMAYRLRLPSTHPLAASLPTLTAPARHPQV